MASFQSSTGRVGYLSRQTGDQYALDEFPCRSVYKTQAENGVRWNVRVRTEQRHVM